MAEAKRGQGHPGCNIAPMCDPAERRDGNDFASAPEAPGAPFLADRSGLSSAFDEWRLAERLWQHDRVPAVVVGALSAMTGTVRSSCSIASRRATKPSCGSARYADHTARNFAAPDRRYRAWVTGITEEVRAGQSVRTLQRAPSTAIGGCAGPHTPAHPPVAHAPATGWRRHSSNRSAGRLQPPAPSSDGLPPAIPRDGSGPHRSRLGCWN